MIKNRVFEVDDLLNLEHFERYYGAPFDLSPDRTTLAFTIIQSTKMASRYAVPFLVGGERGKLGLLELANGALRWVDTPDGVGVFSPLWSPDGNVVAACAFDGATVRPCTIDVATGAFRYLADRNLALIWQKHPLQWIAEDMLACELLPQDSLPIALDCEYRGAMKAMVTWPKAWAGDTPTANVLKTEDTGAPEKQGQLSQIDIATGRILSFDEKEAAPDALKDFAERPLVDYPKPPPPDDFVLPDYGQVATADKASGRTILLVQDDQGTRLLLRDRDGEQNVLFETNGFLKQIKSGGTRFLDYPLTNGEIVRMRCTLPPGYREGERRPAVMWVYPETVIRPAAKGFTLNTSNFFNLQLIAARGYVVLEPSLPHPPDDPSGDLVDSLTRGILPALDAAWSAGFIDRDHVHVFGQSMGGWAVMMLLTKTTVFRTGISMAGISNLISEFGSFDVRRRYDEQSSSHAPDLSEMCKRCWRLDGGPTERLDRYIRYSPLLSANDIAVPLLMFHGDQDYVSISQSEEMYTALRLLGKKAELVRYWGEGHVISSPANIADAWGRIFSWLEAESPAPVQNR